MASLDNVDSLLELLKKDKIDYICIALQSGQKMDKADVYVNLENITCPGNVMSVMIELLSKLNKVPKSRLGKWVEEFIEEEKKNRRRKKNNNDDSTSL